jgi:hypothetical protein
MKLKQKYYKYILKGLPVSKEEEIVFSILNNLTDRSGIGDEWDGIDDEIQEEIIAEWIDIVKTKI